MKNLKIEIRVQTQLDADSSQTRLDRRPSRRFSGLAILFRLAIILPLLLLHPWISASEPSLIATAVGTATEENETLQFEWSIPGTVHDEAGKPVTGAIIKTLPGTEEQITTTSNDDGQFVLAMRSKYPHESSLVVESSDGKLKSFVNAIGYDSPQRLTRVVVKPIKSVIVNVKDKNGAAQQGATIGVIADYGLITSAVADEHGQATLQMPADAEIEWVFAYRDHCGFDYYENYASFPLGPFLTLPDQISLALTGSQTVRVLVVDSNEKPVSGVRVTPWIVQESGKLSYINLGGTLDFAKTDEAGIAEFPWIPDQLERRVSFQINHPEYHCPQPPYFESASSDMTARVLRVATVRGKVTLADGSPAAGVHLQGEGRGNTSEYFRDHTMTREDGSYEFKIYPDQSTIIAVTDTYYAAKSQKDILLKEGQSRDNVDFVVNDGTLIRGKITVGKDRLPAVGEHARLIQSFAGTDLVQFNLTDSKGFYKFRVGPGTYELLLPHQDDEAPIQLTVKDEEEFVFDGYAERKRFVNLTGTVSDESGAALAICIVYGECIAAPRHAGFRTTTDASGNFSAERWSDKMIIYAIHDAKLLAGFAEISEDSTDVAVKLMPATSASGIVRADDGTLVANARVQLNVQLPLVDAMNLNLWTVTNEAGTYVFKGIINGASCRVDVYRADQHTSGPVFEVTNLEQIKLDDVVIKDNGDGSE